jgi:hypothetical protein
MGKGGINGFFAENILSQGKIYKYVSPFTKPLKPAPRAGSGVKRTRFTHVSSFHPVSSPHTDGWNETDRVKRTRFTLLSALGKGFRGLVKGESRFEKPHCRGLIRADRAEIPAAK